MESIALRGVEAKKVNEVDPASSAQLEANINRLYGMVMALNGDRTQIAALATSTSTLADNLFRR